MDSTPLNTETDTIEATPATPPATVSKTKRFRRVAPEDRPSPELVSRQTEATLLAFRCFGSVEAARRFMNEPDETLGGRPIDIAGRSADGLKQVADAMEQHARSTVAVG